MHAGWVLPKEREFCGDVQRARGYGYPGAEKRTEVSKGRSSRSRSFRRNCHAGIQHGHHGLPAGQPCARRGGCVVSKHPRRDCWWCHTGRCIRTRRAFEVQKDSVGSKSSSTIENSSAKETASDKAVRQIPAETPSVADSLDANQRKSGSQEGRSRHPSAKSNCYSSVYHRAASIARCRRC